MNSSQKILKDVGSHRISHSHDLCCRARPDTLLACFKSRRPFVLEDPTSEAAQVYFKLAIEMETLVRCICTIS